MRRLLCLVFLLLIGPVTIPSSVVAMTVSSAANTTAPSPTGISIASPRSDSDLERRNLILEAQTELQSNAYSQLELILTGLGVLMTVVVLFFALNTKDAAVKVAKGEIVEERERFRKMAEEAERQVEDIKREMGEAQIERKELHDELNMAREHTGTISKEFERVAEAVNKRIDEAFSRLAHTERALKAAQIKAEAASDQIEQRTIEMQSGSVPPRAIAASEEDGSPLGDKDAKDLNENDFSVLIAEAASSGNLKEVYELAVTMRRLLSQESAQIYALYAQGWALEQLGRSEEALDAYDDAVAGFEASEHPLVQDWVAKAWLNKAVLLGTLDRPQDAIDTLDALIDRFGTNERDDIRTEVAKALVNKGYRLDELERSGDAQAVFDGVVARFGGSDDFEMRRQVAFALFALAAIAAGNRDSTEAVALLRQWGDKRGEFDPDWVTYDPRFDAIRGDPDLIALLEESSPAHPQEDAEA